MNEQMRKEINELLTEDVSQNQRLDHIIKLVRIVLQIQLHILSGAPMLDLTALSSQVDSTVATEGSAVSALATAQANAGDPVAIAALTAKLKTASDALAAAIAPAAPVTGADASPAA